MTNLQSSCKKTVGTEYDEKSPIIKIAFLEVGQGDTIVISCPSTHEAVVVDCVDADAVLDYFKAEQIMYLRGLIITHLHADHYSGVSSLLDSYYLVPGLQECEVVVFNEILDKRNLDKLILDSDNHGGGTKRSLKTFLRNLQEWLKRGEQEQGKVRCASLKIERRPLSIDGTLARSLELVHPRMSDLLGLDPEGMNNTSGVLRITGPGSSALLTGDLEPKGWLQLQANQSELRCDVLKFPHHGGAWRELDANNLLDNVKPSIVVISVGTDGKKYNHPNPEVFTALHKRPHIHLLCTQATNQCQVSVLDKQNTVIDQFKAHADKNGRQFIRSNRGCPCAGTVIIELGNEARVIQPEIQFHRESIIKPHFWDHQCNIEEVLQAGVVQSKRRSIDP